MNKEIREVENENVLLYAKQFPFSEHLIKLEDELLKEKYDHNYFEYDDSFQYEEFKKALDYQMNKGDDFLKFFGRKKLLDSFHMEEGIVLTMLLENNNTSSWKTNNFLKFKKPSIQEVQANDLKEYGKLYGESFVVKNVERLYDKVEYIGAYLDNNFVGCCTMFEYKGYVCVDEMLVDSQYRNQYVCTTLLKHIVDNHPNKKIFLHASDDDTPKALYEKLGFKTVDQQYEYQLIGLKEYKEKYY